MNQSLRIGARLGIALFALHSPQAFSGEMTCSQILSTLADDANLLIGQMENIEVGSARIKTLKDEWLGLGRFKYSDWIKNSENMISASKIYVDESKKDIVYLTRKLRSNCNLPNSDTMKIDVSDRPYRSQDESVPSSVTLQSGSNNNSAIAPLQNEVQ